jgi:hypothetical protein
MLVLLDQSLSLLQFDTVADKGLIWYSSITVLVLELLPHLSTDD